MKKSSRTIILAGLLLFLGLFNWTVYQKEKLMGNGRTIFLELAPVDPRSLIQGDYMRLAYALERSGMGDSVSRHGLGALALDGRGVARSIRPLGDLDRLGPAEVAIQYSQRPWGGIQFGAESYFFQEGEAEKYGKAKYGGIKVDGKGNSLLIGLFDENLQKIE